MSQSQLYATGRGCERRVLSPGDSEKVRLVKNDSGDYICGWPSAGAPSSLWNLTPVVDGNLTSGFLVGDFSSRGIELLVREEAIEVRFLASE